MFLGMTTQAEGPKPRKALLDSSRRDLDAWARVYRQRDERIRLAYSCGLGVNEITRRTGLAKTTVLRILVTEPTSSTSSAASS
jgi:hypothetical protein